MNSGLFTSAAYAELFIRGSTVPAEVLLDGTGLTLEELVRQDYIGAEQMSTLMANIEATDVAPGWAARAGAQLSVNTLSRRSCPGPGPVSAATKSRLRTESAASETLWSGTFAVTIGTEPGNGHFKMAARLIQQGMRLHQQGLLDGSNLRFGLGKERLPFRRCSESGSCWRAHGLAMHYACRC